MGVKRGFSPKWTTEHIHETKKYWWACTHWEWSSNDWNDWMICSKMNWCCLSSIDGLRCWFCHLLLELTTAYTSVMLRNTVDLYWVSTWGQLQGHQITAKVWTLQLGLPNLAILGNITVHKSPFNFELQRPRSSYISVFSNVCMKIKAWVGLYTLSMYFNVRINWTMSP